MWVREEEGRRGKKRIRRERGLSRNVSLPGREGSGGRLIAEGGRRSDMIARVALAQQEVTV